MAANSLKLKLKIRYEMPHSELQDAITCTNALLNRTDPSSQLSKQFSAHLEKLLQIQLIRASSIKTSTQHGVASTESLSKD